MRCAWAKIDLDRLGLRLRVSLGRTFNDGDVRQWLQQRGFTWMSGSWYACQAGTDALTPDEILARQMRETTDGVTFIDRDADDFPNPRAP